MKQVTGIIIGVTVTLLAFTDLWLLIQGGREATFSEVLLSGAEVSPTIPLAIGYVLGHIFWPQKRK